MMMLNSESFEGDVRNFVRVKPLRFVRLLGSGACGQTVLLHDDSVDIPLVCKKYAPLAGLDRQLLFDNFLREIKLLYLMNHPNIVRVFSHYVYPDSLAGYIIMEHVDGDTIDLHLSRYPEDINKLFLQAIAGFRALAEARILHRDIRAENLMVSTSGTLKIIDLGFGKQIFNSTDFTKSVSLNWWCPTPRDFEDNKYDYSTEVYFLGKLFEKLLKDNDIDSFSYTNVLTHMCESRRSDRPSDFTSISLDIEVDPGEVVFSDFETESYRIFANALIGQITQIKTGATYNDDIDEIMEELEAIYLSSMLELNIPDVSKLVRIFVNGAFFFKRIGLRTDTVKSFLNTMRGCDTGKRRVILSNLHTKLDGIKRYWEDDDIPF